MNFGIAFVFLVAGLVISCREQATTLVWELPDGFRSWIVVEYERADCPTRPRRDGDIVHRVGADGRLCTSDRLREGLFRHRFVYVNADGSREEVFIEPYVGQFTLDVTRRLEYGFIGTKEEQQRSLDSAPPGYPGRP